MALTLPPPRKCLGSLHIHNSHAITLNNLFAAPEGRHSLGQPPPGAIVLRRQGCASGPGATDTGAVCCLTQNDSQARPNRPQRWQGDAARHCAQLGMITTTSTPPSYFPLPSDPLGPRLPRLEPP
ncbi:hypothetical protein PCASD_07090 [Puccinia coronata f. sp. avenae]|uniref:Uncharacterized protein n=1 Tax=Puccinia coronata f. sp. avenae TaxID=200324 RepID=A0A2N5SNE2_9BASI|nr:hypothetical protein PCASD_18776 [Puccinia coronata f. sp. avenae]PLW45684.1 hypothetical protein PCASD_07090 [Puccinia coronata f. sp. avenae]